MSLNLAMGFHEVGKWTLANAHVCVASSNAMASERLATKALTRRAPLAKDPNGVAPRAIVVEQITPSLWVHLVLYLSPGWLKLNSQHEGMAL